MIPNILSHEFMQSVYLSYQRKACICSSSGRSGLQAKERENMSE